MSGIDSLFSTSTELLKAYRFSKDLTLPEIDVKKLETLDASEIPTETGLVQCTALSLQIGDVLYLPLNANRNVEVMMRLLWVTGESALWRRWGRHWDSIDWRSTEVLNPQLKGHIWFVQHEG